MQARYALEQDGQEYLCRLSAGTEAAPEPDEDGMRRVELERDGFLLRIALLDDGQGGWTVLSWSQEKLWKQKETIDNLWSGNFGKEG